MSPDDLLPLPSDRKCPVCGEWIRHGDLTVFLGVELVHLDCHAARDDVTDVVAQFLRRDPAGMFCNVCIAIFCSLQHADVVKATTRLRIRRDFRVIFAGRCTGCSNLRITIGFDPDGMSPDPPAPSPMPPAGPVIE